MEERRTNAFAGPADLYPLPSLRLDGQVGVVTGGASGIGREVALALAAAGAAVAVVDVDEGCEAVAESLRADGSVSHAYIGDVSVPRELETVTQRIGEELGAPEVVVASAGVNARRRALDVSEQEWDHVLDVNLKGAFFTCQAFARRMLDTGTGGSVILIASNFGLVGYPDRAPYVASKAGVVGLTRALALEWAPHVRVNAVCPCLVRTPLVEAQLRDATYANDLLSRIPLGRFAEPRDVAAAVLFLAAPAARMVTGHALAVDGGWTAQ